MRYSHKVHYTPLTVKCIAVKAQIQLDHKGLPQLHQTSLPISLASPYT